MLTCRDLSCVRGARPLWNNVGFSVDGGGALHVTGANGAGKSSLLRIVAGLLPSASGAVTCHAKVGLVDEQHAIDRELPLAQALAFWTALDGKDGARADEALQRMGISALAPVPPRMFSTGQRKRAALARLWLQDAGLWLLDEPMNGLDSDGMTRLSSLIADHRAHGGAVVIASHQAMAIPDMATLNLAEHAA